jgi:hypothetical protein
MNRGQPALVRFIACRAAYARGGGYHDVEYQRRPGPEGTWSAGRPQRVIAAWQTRK